MRKYKPDPLPLGAQHASFFLKFLHIFLLIVEKHPILQEGTKMSVVINKGTTRLQLKPLFAMEFINQQPERGAQAI